ncbi:GNAT family N-acetyltransferase [Caldimonas brevitalea]|uniref:GCN5 family acetyltransferase n=1 Tax=Caldimonas brevitalea TaxID=413882 RepID=A0A0G3BWE3_9BURK|nr:GNAT family N-acetyltransferase [Caldimonas brevitalea]AKJ31716.1 GCN5 family acetyltransferase [Caldimonas brevitalea]
MESPEIRLVVPDRPELLNAAREIFKEYADSLGVDLGFQGFETELRSLPEPYAPPGGQLLLAYVDAQLAGCGAFRYIAETDYPNACEMRRLYVRKPFRRFGLGRTIAQALIDEARRCGYSSVLLDTIDEMEAARSLYTSLGFHEIPPYYFNPLPGAHYLKAELG